MSKPMSYAKKLTLCELAKSLGIAAEPIENSKPRNGFDHAGFPRGVPEKICTVNGERLSVGALRLRIEYAQGVRK